MANANLRATMEATALEFFSSYVVAAAQNDPSLVNRNVTPDCKRHLLPQSMLRDQGIPLDLAIDNELYQAEFAKDLAFGSVQRHDVANMVIDVEARRLAATTSAYMLFKVGEKETLELEFSWFFDFNEDGTKITRVVEFTDGDAVRKMAAKKEEQ